MFHCECENRVTFTFGFQCKCITIIFFYKRWAGNFYANRTIVISNSFEITNVHIKRLAVKCLANYPRIKSKRIKTSNLFIER